MTSAPSVFGAMSSRPGRALAATLLLALAAALTAAPARAQQSMTPEAFLSIAEGKTLTFRNALTGDLVGVEQFLSASRSVWARADGTCAYGTVTVEGPEVCFTYDDDAADEGPHCWWPLREGLRLYVRLADATRDETQEVTAISQEPVACTAAPSF